MAYNNGREDRKWRIWKEAEEKVLREHGVDEATIEQIRIDDRADFNSNRRFYHWTSDFGEYLEGMADREQSAEVKTVEDLLDEIEDENLYQALLTVDRRTLQIVLLKMKGYEVDFSGGHWKMKLPQYKHFTRLDTLDERLTPDFIRSHLGTRARYGNYKAKISYSPHMPEEYKKAWKPHQKTRGILALYYYWCYQLGIFPKGTDYKPTSPLMKEELRKLDEITTQVRYMSEHNISTLSDLHADREKNQTEMDRLTNYRRHLQNKIRRASPAEKETLREEKNGVTERITELRKRLKYADGIEKRSAHIDDCLNQIHDTVENQRSNQNGRTDRKREDALR